MDAAVKRHGYVTVDYLYSLLGLSSVHTDALYGWYSTSAMAPIQKGDSVLMTFPEPVAIPAENANKNISAQASAIKNYAQQARRIYTNRSAGEFTWEGLLSCFLAEATRR
ncbi:MAG TPA: hypothetical protein PKW49_00985 [Paludibacteraceae bacterium]|nr:hypothetical protein [Paludibacteraceae bacterium]